MDNKIKQHFKDVEKLYLTTIEPYILNYGVNIEIVDLVEKYKDDEIVGKYYINSLPIFDLDIIVASEIYKKKLEFSFTSGVNLKTKAHEQSIKFSIKCLEDWFSLQDYFTYNNIENIADDYFNVNNIETISGAVNKFIRQIAFLMERDDIKRILSSDEWIDVPHDKSMYF